MAGRDRARIHTTATLAAGATVVLSPEAGHYLVKVMRAAPGETARLFNAADGEWRARLEAAKARAVTLSCLECLRPAAPEPGRDVWLAFAPIKKAALDVVVRMATELGATRLVPVITARTEAGRVNLARLEAQAIEAAEQCERLAPPTVAEPATLSALLEDWPAGRPLFAALERQVASPLAKAVAGLPSARGVGLLIGPEGGFDERELDLIHRFDFVAAVSLGPRILRAETAVAAGLAIIAAAG